MRSDGWFTVEEIDRRTFAISEYGHWEKVHSYLLTGSRRAVLIDTGLGVSNIRFVTDALTELPVDVVTTHVHWDHIGSHEAFDTIAVHELECGWIDGAFPLPIEAVKANLLREPCEFPEGFDVQGYHIAQKHPDTVLRDGDTIDLGGRSLWVLHTPGHSPGHCCYYEEESGYLFSGDLIYAGCLDAFYPTTDPKQFARSIRRVKNLKVSKILPGHYALEIPVKLIGVIDEAFTQLKERGLLKQGAGVFSFSQVDIHL